MQADNWFDHELMDWIHGFFFGHVLIFPASRVASWK
jgi:hypothetical protein